MYPFLPIHNHIYQLSVGSGYAPETCSNTDNFPYEKRSEADDFPEVFIMFCASCPLDSDAVLVQLSMGKISLFSPNHQRENSQNSVDPCFWGLLSLGKTIPTQEISCQFFVRHVVPWTALCCRLVHGKEKRKWM